MSERRKKKLLVVGITLLKPALQREQKVRGAEGCAGIVHLLEARIDPELFLPQRSSGLLRIRPLLLPFELGGQALIGLGVRSVVEELGDHPRTGLTPAGHGIVEDEILATQAKGIGLVADNEAGCAICVREIHVDYATGTTHCQKISGQGY